MRWRNSDIRAPALWSRSISRRCLTAVFRIFVSGGSLATSTRPPRFVSCGQPSWNSPITVPVSLMFFVPFQIDAAGRLGGDAVEQVPVINLRLGRERHVERRTAKADRVLKPIAGPQRDS